MARRYLFYPTADAAQDRIWRDTVEIWGEAKAETYIRGLHRHLDKLAATPALWRSLPAAFVISDSIDVKPWLSRYEHHYIIFRQLSGGRIGVISLLHERMDLPVRLAEDLLNMMRGQTE